MSRSLTNLSVLASFCAAAWPTTLVPVPTAPQPSFPVAGLEANRGQANAGILFLSPASGSSIAVAAQSVLFSPLGATLNLVASNPNPTVSFSDPLSGLVNSYTGADPAKWVTGIPRYATATLAATYSGIDAEYTVDSGGVLTLHLLLAPGANLNAVQFSIPQAASISTSSNGSLTAKFGSAYTAPTLAFQAAASQTGPSGQMNPSASFTVQSATGFGLSVQGIDSTLPLQIAFQLNPALYPSSQADFTGSKQRAVDAAGDTYYVIAVADAAGKAAPFPAISGVGCGLVIDTPVACTDVALYKYSAPGTLEFITYLEGGVNETPGFVGLTPDGKVAVAGTTDSADFPVTANAAQNAYAGPAASPAHGSGTLIGGDFFAAELDPATGQLRSATFLGSPNADTMGTAALGSDGSLYFLPAPVGTPSAGMPVTSGALQAACQNDPCQNGYVARLSPGLDRLIFGTYLPGISQATAQLYSDGSVYYAGTAAAGFPTTPNAYQPLNAGGYDGIVARLDPTGTRLLFGTYYGGPNTDWILGIAVAPDGSVWATVSSFIQCCVNIQPQLIHLDTAGVRLLASLPINGDPIVVDAAGNLIALAEGPIIASKDAILGGSCGGPAYIELSPSGQQLFASYLPGGSQISFNGVDAQGKPYVSIPPGRFQVVESQPTPPSVGCVVDAAGFANEQRISPGAIVTIFGGGMGPSPGVGFQLVNGLVPTSLGGTQVLVNGAPAPILYSSYGQLNLIIPYSLAAGSTASLQVVSNGTPLNQLSNVTVLAQLVSLFAQDSNGSAAALNEDYTVNSPQHPARPGSTVMLFGTGGGQTDPPSTAGEVTPLELHPLLSVPQVIIQDAPQPIGSGTTLLNVEYAGAAPALVSGVTQINVTMPDVIPTATGYPPGTLPLLVIEPGVPFYSNQVTISVSNN